MTRDSIEAQFNLASMLFEGEGCERDASAAEEWLNRSVAGGYEYAMELLAIMKEQS